MFTIRHRNPPSPPIKQKLNQNKMKEQTKDNNTLVVSNVRQTAVEFYREELNALVSFKESKFKTEQEIFEQAKEMEKKHLYNFYMQGGVDAILEADRNVEQYYNETFKSE